MYPKEYEEFGKSAQGGNQKQCTRNAQKMSQNPQAQKCNS